jgi:hypothetical protein
MIGLGDDNVLAVNITHDNMPDFMEFIKDIIVKLGLKAKLKNPMFPTYCSCEFVPLNDRNTNRTKYVLIPAVLRFISKMGFTISDLNTNKNLERLKGNMLGNKNLKFMPVLRVFYKHYTSQSKSKIKADNYSDSLYSVHKQEIAPYETFAGTYHWFCSRHGITDDQLYELERYINTILSKYDDRPVMWNHRVIAQMMDI